MSSEGSLVVSSVTVSFGSTIAVDHADLTVQRGEIVALLGPSGCGKSSLLRAVAGLVPLAAGRVEWLGRDLDRVPPHRRGMGLMFQHHALFPHRNVVDNVAFGLRMRGMSSHGRRERAGELLDLVGLSGFGDRAVDTLSGGQAQRVALARALAPEPALLLLDEPLASLDRALSDRLAGEIRAIVRSSNTTAIYVTHDQDEAVTVADRLAVMARGRILATGRFDELRADPGSVEIAEALALDTIWEAEVRDGQVVTPWGSASVRGVGGPRCWVLLEPRYVGVDVTGEGPGATVLGRLRRGERWHLRCRLHVAAGGATEITARSEAPVSEGAEVSLDADLSGLRALADGQGQPTGPPE